MDESLEQEMRLLTVKVEELARVVSDHAPRDWVTDLERRVRYQEDLIDTYLHSPVWKRIWFWAMGWPADEIASKPKRRWWTS